jgi:peptidoglycan hydrolase CwlO-like protein
MIYFILVAIIFFVLMFFDTKIFNLPAKWIALGLGALGAVVLSLLKKGKKVEVRQATERSFDDSGLTETTKQSEDLDDEIQEITDEIDDVERINFDLVDDVERLRTELLQANQDSE